MFTPESSIVRLDENGIDLMCSVSVQIFISCTWKANGPREMSRSLTGTIALNGTLTS
jgi:hypothetical protein